jgi:hypothetical protein
VDERKEQRRVHMISAAFIGLIWPILLFDFLLAPVLSREGKTLSGYAIYMFEYIAFSFLFWFFTVFLLYIPSAVKRIFKYGYKRALITMAIFVIILPFMRFFTYGA